MTVIYQPRKINNTMHDMPTVNGMDRCEINTKLHYLNVEMDKLKVKQAALIDARDQLDRHAEIQESGDYALDLFDQISIEEDLFDQMFGGE